MGGSSFVNPPYSAIKDWIAKDYQEWQKGKTVVFLIPSRTDTRWWHDYVMQATEIRFIKGRLKFGDAKNSAPFRVLRSGVPWSMRHVFPSLRSGCTHALGVEHSSHDPEDCWISTTPYSHRSRTRGPCRERSAADARVWVGYTLPKPRY